MKYIKPLESFCSYPPTPQELIDDTKDDVDSIKKAKEEKKRKEDEAAEYLAKGIYAIQLPSAFETDDEEDNNYEKYVAPLKNTI